MLRIYFPRFGNESSYDNRKPREPPFDKARFIRCTNNFLSSFFSTIVTYLFLFNSNYFVARSFIFKSRSNSFLRNNFNIVRLFFRSSLGNRSYRNGLCWENTLYLTWNVEKVVAKIQNFNLEDDRASRKFDENPIQMQKELTSSIYPIDQSCNKILNLEKKKRGNYLHT